MHKKHTFHKHEVALCGFSDSGKTTLITSLISHFTSEKYQVGYVKHDAHKFEMDKKGKDTQRAYECGARQVLITSDEKWATIAKGELLFADQRLALLDSDFVLVEGYKNSKIPKLLLLGDEDKDKDKYQEIEKLFLDNKLENVIGLIGTANIETLHGLPYFNRNNIEKIADFIKLNFIEEIEKTPIYGLVLAGGHSKRMQTDKGAISYHGKNQTQHCHDLLSEYCDKVFVSCRHDQKEEEHIKTLPQIEDRISNLGPMGGILSAFWKHPDASWLVVACDLPYLNHGTIQELLQKRNPFKLATCFLNPIKKWPEPLCTVYEPKARARLLQMLALDMSCPRKILFNSEIKILNLKDLNALDNANTPEDYNKAKELI